VTKRERKGRDEECRRRERETENSREDGEEGRKGKGAVAPKTR